MGQAGSQTVPPLTVRGLPGSKQAGEMRKTKPKGHRGRKRGYDGPSGNGGTHVEVLRWRGGVGSSVLFFSLLV